ncbi:resolvase [Priestia megaterium]|uniref:Resolvase n=1 Tax=Priestia megaterium TaxID=1404 RepID=A0AA86I6N3_PRIMG|nr:recombinase family protein [Priestia megaterium]AXI31465.1 resolvase [Priestia megaterium]
MKYGYARVSTINQDLKGQIDILKEEGCEIIFKEKFTGTTAERPQLAELIQTLKEGDTLVVTKLDRLARNTKDGIEIIESLFDKGVNVHVKNVGLMEDTSMGRFFLQTLLAVAEMERNMIVERTQEGKAIARQRDDFREGRPKKFKKKNIEDALRMLDEGMSYKEVSEMKQISVSTLTRAKRKAKAEAIEKASK